MNLAKQGSVVSVCVTITIEWRFVLAIGIVLLARLLIK